MKKSFSVILLGLILVVAVLLLGPLWWIVYHPSVATFALTEPPSVFLQNTEARTPGIKPGNESRIGWGGEIGKKTDFVFVYIHGFSAGPSEISPVVENLAEKFSANSYFPRLSAHGKTDDVMENLSADDLFNDAERAYVLAKELGQKIVLVGTSTGATLALWLAERHADVAGLVLVSPNLGIKDPRGFLAAGPVGYLLARLIAGPYHDWTPRHPGQEQFWTTHYSVNGIRAMTDVVNEVAHSDLSAVKVPVLCFWTSLDKVVDSALAIRQLQLLSNSKNKFVEIKTTEHVLAGKITASENVQSVGTEAAEFIKANF